MPSCIGEQDKPATLVNTPTVIDSIKQKAALDKILSLLPPDRIINGRVSFLDETFQDWLKRTGELPPDLT